MDKKLLDALNNVSDAIVLLSEALNDKTESKSATANALQSSDMGKKIKSLELGIKNLEKDTKEILKNQKTIIDLSSKKSSDKTDEVASMGSDPKKKKNIKDGVGVVLMIAVGVLAIGLAFKIIGGVDFGSVIALSIALPLVAIAFEKIAQMKDLKAKEMVNLVLVTIAISTAIMLSSYVLGMVQPVGLFQLFTAVFIAAMFGAVSFGIGKLISGLTQMGITMSQMFKVSIFLPIVMVAVSAAIAGSSYMLSRVQPVGLFQLITSVFIAAAFGVIAMGLGKLVEGISKIGDPKKAATIALLMPVVLVGVAAAITGASYLLAQVQPIGLFQFFTAVMIAIIFIPISFALPFIAKALEKVDIKRIVLLPIMLVAVAGAIWLSSLIFAQIPGDKLTFALLAKIVLLSIALTVVAASMGTVIYLFDKFKLTVDKAIEGGISIVIIATALMLTSLILSIGNYDNYPPLPWVASVALSLIAFGGAAVILGIIATSGIGALAIVAGAAAILVVAAAVVATAAILGTGDYGNYPSVGWSTSVALSMAAFGAGILVLGTYVVGTLGLGGLAIAAGAEAVKVVAQSIVDASIILKGGDFTGGPTKEWAEGIAITLGAFSPIYGMLMKNAIFDLFGGGGVGPEQFAEAVVTISKGIVQAATEFNGASVAFEGGPKKEWAEGVGQAIGAFAPVYAVLAENSGWLSSGPSVEDMAKAIQTISQGIVDAAKFFGENAAVFDPTKAPNKEWSEGVGAAIKGFAPVFDFLSKNTGFLTSGDEAIAMMQKGIISVAVSIVGVSRIISGGKFGARIDPAFIKNVSDGIKQYIAIIDYLADKEVDDFDVLEEYADGLVYIADAYEKFATSIEKLNGSLANLDLEKVGALKTLTGGIILMSLMDSDQFENMMDALEEKAEIFVETINKLEGDQPASKKEVTKPKVNVKAAEVSVAASKTPQTSLKDILMEIQKVTNNTSSIAADTKSIQEHIIEKSDSTMLGSKKMSS
jgi:hypothetical protein